MITYGNRWTMAGRVAQRLLESGAQDIVIVNNNSGRETADGLTALKQQNGNRIRLLHFTKNVGTAIAMKAALQKALEINSTFVFIVDDDNLPAENTLALLKTTFSKQQHKYPIFALQAGRKGRNTSSGQTLLPPANAYMGFSITRLASHLMDRIFGKRQVKKRANAELQSMDAAAYGGLFFPTALLQKVPLPDESYILYMDDFDFTLKMIQAGYPVFEVPGAIVEDLEASYYFPPKKGLFYHSALVGKNIPAIYYSLRNNVWFTRKHLLTNGLLFSMNKICFLTLITLLALINGKPGRLTVIFRAGKDARNGRMGQSPIYPLDRKI